MKSIIKGSEVAAGDDEERLRFSLGKLRQEFEGHIIALATNRLGSPDHLGVREVVNRVLNSLETKVFEDDLPANWNWRAWIDEECLRSCYDELRQEFERLIVAQVSKLLGSPTHHGVRDVVDRVLDSLKRRVFKDEPLPSDWNWRGWISGRSQNRTHDFLRRFGESRRVVLNFNDLEDASQWGESPSSAEARAAFNLLSSSTNPGYTVAFDDEAEIFKRLLTAAAKHCEITVDDMVEWKIFERTDHLPSNILRNTLNVRWGRFLEYLHDRAKIVEQALQAAETQPSKKSLKSLHQKFQEKFGINIGEYKLLMERSR